MWASSMGLSFCVPEQVTSVLVTAEWGQYRKAESEQYLRKDGSGGRTVWKRHPISKPTAVPLDERVFRAPAHDDFPDVQLAARIVRSVGTQGGGPGAGEPAGAAGCVEGRGVAVPARR